MQLVYTSCGVGGLQIVHYITPAIIVATGHPLIIQLQLLIVYSSLMMILTHLAVITATMAALFAVPLDNFPRGGDLWTGSLHWAGISGGYWSSTAGSAAGSYRLDFGSANTYPSAHNGRYSGFSLRCVAR